MPLQESEIEQQKEPDVDESSKKPLTKLEKIENFIVSTLLFAILVLVIIQVYTRFVTGDSTTWTGELSRFVAIWLIFLGSAIALRRKLHIQVDNLFNVVSPKIGTILYVIRNIVSIGFLTIVLIGSISMLDIVSLQKSPSLGIRMDAVYIILPISVILMLVILLLEIFLRIKRKRG